jgi:hypothetical protein
MRRRKPPEPAKHTLDDEWMLQSTKTASVEMAKWMAANIKLFREFKTMTREEARMMAEVAILKWIVLATERMHTEPDSDDSAHLRLLLM